MLKKMVRIAVIVTILGAGSLGAGTVVALCCGNPCIPHVNCTE